MCQFITTNYGTLTNFASDCTGCGEEGPGIPGILGTTVTGLTSCSRKSGLLHVYKDTPLYFTTRTTCPPPVEISTTMNVYT